MKSWITVLRNALGAAWLITSLPYDYQSIMHYRACWASARENECVDGRSPGTVISPVDPKYDDVIGQWTDNYISALDAEKARLVYGMNFDSEGRVPRVPK